MHSTPPMAKKRALEMNAQWPGPRAIIDQWTRLSSFASGRKIEIDDGVRRIAGVTRGLNPLGALRVEQRDGRTEEVYSGDVVSWK